jgi:hypothetical protein
VCSVKAKRDLKQATVLCSVGRNLADRVQRISSLADWASQCLKVKWILLRSAAAYRSHSEQLQADANRIHHSQPGTCLHHLPQGDIVAARSELVL